MPFAASAAVWVSASAIDISYPALRKPGGIPFSHPLVTAARETMENLGIQPLTGPSYSDLSVLISKDIPAVTLGLTRAERVNEPEERVEIAPYLTGLAQTVALLARMDKEVGSYLPEEEIPAAN